MSPDAVVVCLGGAGDMGATLCRQLSKSPRVGHVIVADLDGERAEQVASRLREAASSEVSATRVDVLDAAALKSQLAGADFVANAAGPFFRLAIPTLEAAIDSGTPYLDICDDPEPTRSMLALDGRARAAGVAAVIGMGASPGLSNLLARRAASRLDRVIDCYTAWPLDAGGGNEDEQALSRETAERGRASAAAVHLMEQISGEIAVVSEGKLVMERPLAPVTLDYPGQGRGTAITVGHPEPVTLHRSLGVEGRAANLMLVKRTTGPYLELLRRDIDAGKIDLESAALELFSPSAKRSVKALARAATAKGAGALPPFFALLRGERAGEQLWVGCHVTGLPSGMDGATAIPAALAVDQLLAHPAPPGVHAPDSVLEPEPLLEALLPHCPGEPANVDALAPISEAPA